MDRDDEFDSDYESYSDYSDIMRPTSPEIHVPDPLEVIDKFIPVILTPIIPLTRVQIDHKKDFGKEKFRGKGYYVSIREDNRICIDPFLPKKFPSPAISISPSSDAVRTNKFPTKILGAKEYASLFQSGVFIVSRSKYYN